MLLDSCHLNAGEFRRKGEVTSKQIDRNYRHQVEIDIPPFGLGTRLNEMHEFCPGLDFKTHGIGNLSIERGGKDGVRFCFKTPEEAERFFIEFGGVKLTLPDPFVDIKPAS